MASSDPCGSKSRQGKLNDSGVLDRSTHGAGLACETSAKGGTHPDNSESFLSTSEPSSASHCAESVQKGDVAPAPVDLTGYPFALPPKSAALDPAAALAPLEPKRSGVTLARMVVAEVKALACLPSAASTPGLAGIFIALDMASVAIRGGKDCAEFLRGHAATVERVGRGGLWTLTGRALQAAAWCLCDASGEARFFLPELGALLDAPDLFEARAAFRGELFRSAFPAPDWRCGFRLRESGEPQGRCDLPAGHEGAHAPAAGGVWGHP